MIKSDPGEILAEYTSAHDYLLNCLLAQAAQLCAEAWTNHKAERTKLDQEAHQCDFYAGRRSDQDKPSISVSHHRDLESRSSQSKMTRVGNIANMPTWRDLVKEAWLQAKFEASAECERGSWLSSCALRAVSVRACHVVERARQARALIKLQHSLRVCCARHNQAVAAYRSNQSDVNKQFLLYSQLAVMQICENLRERGHQRRLLQEEELSCVRSELSRLRRDRESKIEQQTLRAAVKNAQTERNHV